MTVKQVHGVSVSGVPCSRQQGAVLIVGLIILVILTILGVGYMNTSSLELQMSSNALQKTASFNLAEDVRLLAEQTVDNIVEEMEDNDGRRFLDTVSTNGDGTAGHGFYDLTDTTTSPAQSVDSVEFWGDVSNYQPAGAAGTGFVIEYLGVFPLYVDRVQAANGAGAQLMHLFRLTVVGKSVTGATTAVQAIYMRN